MELSYDNGMIISTAEHTVLVWELFSDESPHVIANHDMVIDCLQANQYLVASGSRDGLLTITDFSNPKNSRCHYHGPPERYKEESLKDLLRRGKQTNCNIM